MSNLVKLITGIYSQYLAREKFDILKMIEAKFTK